MTTTASVADTLATTKRVHQAMRVVLADLDYRCGFAATRVRLDGEAIHITAPNANARQRWEERYPDRTVMVDRQPVPLHIAVEGDVEGGRS